MGEGNKNSIDSSALEWTRTGFSPGEKKREKKPWLGSEKRKFSGGITGTA